MPNIAVQVRDWWDARPPKIVISVKLNHEQAKGNEEIERSPLSKVVFDRHSSIITFTTPVIETAVSDFIQEVRYSMNS